MNETTNKTAFLSGSALKLIAVITMLIDHIGAFLYFFDFFRINLFTIAGRDITVYYLFRSIGRSAFPIYCFLIGEGYLHTKNRFRYGMTLLIGALISEIPFNLVFNGTCFYRDHQNVFFTLLLGYLGIVCYEKFKEKNIVRILSILALAAVAYFLKADYGLAGYGLVLLFYLLSFNRLAICIAGCLILNLRTLPGLICITCYNGKRGFINKPVLKYAFYAFYPVHLFILYLIQMMLGLWK